MMDEAYDGAMARILGDEQWRLVIGLHRRDVNQGKCFSERLTGLNHIGLDLPDRDELAAWQHHFQKPGVHQSAIADRPPGSLLVFRLPDNVQLDLFAQVSV